jgi:hypothetical protein
MTQVYGASRINLAASGATNGSEGCFFNRHPAWRCKIPITINSSQQLWDCYRRNFRKSLLDMPLLKRGWVLQERMLPPWTLHFTRTEVFWECDNISASETFPNGLPPKISNHISITKRPLSASIWREIVKRYSNCFPTSRRTNWLLYLDLHNLSRRRQRLSTP